MTNTIFSKLSGLDLVFFFFHLVRFKPQATLSLTPLQHHRDSSV